MNVTEIVLTISPSDDRFGKGNPQRAPQRPLTRISSLAIGALIASVMVLALSPADARHLMELIARILHLQTAADDPAAAVAAAKPIEVTITVLPDPKPKPKAAPKPAAASANAATSANKGTPSSQSPAAASAATAADKGTPSSQSAAAATAATAADKGTPSSQSAPASNPVADAPPTATPGLSADAPVLTTPGKTSQPDAAPAAGIPVPALRFSLPLEVIAALVRSGNAVIVASTGGGDAQYVLGTGGQFAKATAAQMASLSTRAFPVKNPALLGVWSVALKRQDGQHDFAFNLRFSSGTEASIVSEQFNAVKAKGIDLAKEMASGHVVVTDGAFDPATLTFHVVGVSEE